MVPISWRTSSTSQRGFLCCPDSQTAFSYIVLIVMPRPRG